MRKNCKNWKLAQFKERARGINESLPCFFINASSYWRGMNVLFSLQFNLAYLLYHFTTNITNTVGHAVDMKETYENLKNVLFTK